MNKIFLSICFSILFAAQVKASAREFGGLEEAQADVAARNREVVAQASKPEKLPQNDEEMRAFVQERMKYVDVTVLPKNERIDKSSSFSMVGAEQSEPKKSFWEKIYDNAIARVSNTEPEENPDIQYYSLAQETPTDASVEQMPIINISLPNGASLKAPAYEHIPVFSTQIEVLPNRMVKVYENIVVVANGGKVKEGLVRFVKKQAPSRQNKVQVMLDEVKVNGTKVDYELAEQNDFYVIRPVRNFKLAEGVYVFEFRYVLDRYLWNHGDFYEFYWDQTGGNYNLLVNRAITAIKLPGREPAVKKYALTGRPQKMDDANTVVTAGENNTVGFMNLFPLLNGESMRIFMTIPKVDFLPISSGQKMVQLIDDYGDIALGGLFLAVMIVSSLLSWRYIRNKLEFKTVNLSSSVLLRALWRGAPDKKAVGGVLLELFRKNIIDIQRRDEDIILVRKSVHSKNISKFERRVLKLLFSKKDSICKLSSGVKANKFLDMALKKAQRDVARLGFSLSKGYVMFDIAMLLAIEIGLVLWNGSSLMWAALLLADLSWLLMWGGWRLFGKNWQRKSVALVMIAVALAAALLFLSVYISLTAAVLLSLGVCCALAFVSRAAEQDALLKNAVQSAYKLREFLLEQKDNIGAGRNFAVQQPNILVLDLEQEYPENLKNKNAYRLAEVNDLLERLY